MLVRMPIIGGGVEGDPRTVGLPTWRYITEVQNGAAMIVSIPAEDEPDDVDAPGTARRPIINGIPVLIGLTPIQRMKWRARIAKRWEKIADYSQVDVV